jgi:hypothetical protein
MEGSSPQQSPGGRPSAGSAESQAEPSARLVGGNRVVVEFTIDDLIARALSLQVPIPGCNGCHGCRAID